VITVLRPSPFATVQDLGRAGYQHAAVARGGALDPFALALANVLVGNEPGAAAIEWGLAGGELRLERNTTIALTGAKARATLGERGVPNDRAVHAAAGEVLRIALLEEGAWLYLAIAGGIDLPPVLGSRATYLPARFGGLEGRLLRPGDRLPTGEPRSGVAPGENRGVDAAGSLGADPIAILPGPDRHWLPAAVWPWLTQTEFRVSRAVSRMGYRLEGVRPPFSLLGDMPSAPACVGTIQLPPGGEPIVLLPDGPTVGGYPRVAVVATADIGRLAQRRPGQPIRFRPIGLEEARTRLRDQWGGLGRLY
jgi:biotin-dependent carboxylase-like uncharacterized protein